MQPLPAVALQAELGRANVKRIEIERKSKLSQAEIAREHLWDGGKPVIVTDATENWPARSKWTFEFFKTTYGSDPGIAWRGLGSGIGKLITLSSYIDYLDLPLGELPGLWTGKKIGKDGLPPQDAPGQKTSPFYLLDWYAFRQHPELYDDIIPAPGFLLDWALALSPTVRTVLERTSGAEYWAIYLGPEGSLSKLHRDYWNTHSYLAQIRGRKRAILFSPRDSDFVYGGKVNPEEPDFDRFPLFGHATAYECVIEPGETLIMPANWWHHVTGLDKSITVSHNFFTDSNFSEHMVHVFRNLPALMKNIDSSPDWRRELRIEWSARDLTNVD